MSNPNLPLSASPAGIMPPSDKNPMASDEDETMSPDEDDTMHSNEDGTDYKIHSYLPYSDIREPRSCIFWDVVDFPLPNDVDPVSIYQRMNTFIESKSEGHENYELSIILYVDDMERYDAFKDAGFTILSREGIVEAGAYFMLIDIAMWVSDNPSYYDYPILMVISKKIINNLIFFDFFYDLALRGYIVLSTLDNIPGPLEKECILSTVSLEHLERHLLGGVESSSDHKRKSVEEACHSTSSRRQKVGESS